MSQVILLSLTASLNPKLVAATTVDFASGKAEPTQFGRSK